MDDKINISQEVEIRRCAEDFTYFCENYVKINHPIKGIINFILHPYQKRYVESLQNNRFVICKKFRQGGFTTLTEVYFLWLAMFKFDQRIMTVSRTDRECCYMSDMVRRVIDQFPEWLQPDLGKNNNHTIEFKDTGCSMVFLTPEPAKGRKTDYVLFDEAAFWDSGRHWKAVWPMVSCGGKAYIVSSTNGTKDNWFYETYTAAEKLQNNFKIFHCSYLDHPDYSNENWAANTKQALGARGWRQEVLCEFLDPDNRTHQQKLDDTLQFFEDMSAAEELVENLNKGEKPKRERDFKKEIRNLEDWKIGEDHLGEKGLDWKLEKVYTEDPKPLKTEEPEYKPQAYQFRRMSREEQKAFINGYEARHTKPVGHPEFEQPLNLNDVDELTDLWTDVAELYPQYEEVKNFWAKTSNERNRKNEEIEDRINECIEVDMLVLAGVVSKNEAKTLPTYKVFARPDLKIIDTIKSSGRYSEDLTLNFSNNRLCVNKVPTVIKEDDVRDLYNGVFSLIGYEQAVETVVKAITSKLDILFLENNDAESLAKEALK
jgi:hypothetical protein